MLSTDAARYIPALAHLNLRPCRLPANSASAHGGPPRRRRGGGGRRVPAPGRHRSASLADHGGESVSSACTPGLSRPARAADQYRGGIPSALADVAVHAPVHDTRRAPSLSCNPVSHPSDACGRRRARASLGLETLCPAARASPRPQPQRWRPGPSAAAGPVGTVLARGLARSTSLSIKLPASAFAHLNVSTMPTRSTSSWIRAERLPPGRLPTQSPRPGYAPLPSGGISRSRWGRRRARSRSACNVASLRGAKAAAVTTWLASAHRAVRGRMLGFVRGDG